MEPLKHQFIGQPTTPEALKEVIDAAVLAEREACAKVCEQTGDTTGECPEMAGYCADAIRMRSNA